MSGETIDMSRFRVAPPIGGVRAILPVLIAALVLQGLISQLRLDYIWSHWLFELEGGHWLLKDHWLFSAVIHTGGRRLSILLVLGCLLMFGLSFRFPWLSRHRPVLAYLSLAPLLASAAVLLGKRLSGVDCPWSLLPFGGDLPYQPLLQQLLSPGGGACFPAGHASAGYAWFALYFAAAAVWPALRLRVLLAVLMVGGLFGFAQQLRGAHFLSHDLWSLVLCWSVCALLAARMLPRRSGVEAQVAI